MAKKAPEKVRRLAKAKKAAKTAKPAKRAAARGAVARSTAKPGKFVWKDHLFADGKGEFAADLNGWERAFMKWTQGQTDFVCWLRNFERRDWAFCIPYEKGGEKPFYPDFVIVHPGRGLLVLEVKDWRLDSITGATKADVELLTHAGVVKTLSPFAQARQHMFEVMKLIQNDGMPLHPPGHALQGKSIVPFGHGVVFTNITRRQFDATNLSEMFPEDLCVFKDEMSERANPELFRAHLEKMVSMRAGEALTLPQFDRARVAFPRDPHPADRPAARSPVAVVRGPCARRHGPAPGVGRTRLGRRPPHHSRRRRLRQDAHPRLPRRIPRARVE